ncbi:MAG: amidohydrolase [Thermoplasmata archaeon]|nr:amidohydrolase [Thermoplasmata archaeon]
MKVTADLVLVGGRVHTWSEEVREADAVAMGKGRILAVGKRPEAMGFEGPETRVLDVGGRVVLPGFNDCHVHLASYGARIASLDLTSAASLEDLQARVAETAQGAPGDGWLLGHNWDESKWPDRRYPLRSDLDAATAARPVALSRVDTHMAVVNSEALTRLQLEGVEGVERDAAGEPTGVLKEDAMEVVREATRPDASTIQEGLLAMIQDALRLGITSVSETISPYGIAAYLALQRAGKLTLRVNLMPRADGLPALLEGGFGSGIGGGLLRLGPVKAFFDGSLGARTAALTEDFADEPGNRGMLIYTEGEATSLVRDATEGGFQLALHAIGDRGIRTAFHHLVAEGGTGFRHRIEHLELPSEDDLKTAARHGLVASMQPNFVGQWSLPGGMYEDRLGPARLRGNNPFRRVLDRGIPLAFGSDNMPLSPLYGVHWAVNAPFEDQRLTVDEALRAYTLGSAYASGEEELKGSIEPGKLADLVVLEQDPWDRPEAIEAIRVNATILGGRLVYQA